MKKLLATVMCLVLLSFAALPAGAQTRRRNHRANVQQQQQRQYDYNDGYRNDRYRDNRSFWQKHRDKLTTAGGAVGGAILGGMLGGKKGAAIGAMAGGGGAAVYTYKIRNKDRRY